MRKWVFLLALFALSATALAQDFDGEEEAPIADSEGGSLDAEHDNEEVPEVGEEEEVEVDGEEVGSPVSTSDVTPVDENEDSEIDTDIPEDADEAHVADSETEGATEEQLLANESLGEEVQINAAEAENIESEKDDEDWGVSQSQSQTTKKPEWKEFPLYSGSIDVEKDCGCKIKWMKKVYNRPKPCPKFYHFHKSVGFHNHHRHHCRRVVPFPRRRHVHHIVRHHVHHKKPCGCLKKTVIKNIVVHHPKPIKPCDRKKNHHHGHKWRFGRIHH